MIYSPVSKANFLPDDRLSQLTSHENVRSVLIERGLQSVELDRLVSSVTSHGRKLFAILVFCHASQAIKGILDSGWTDTDLPLDVEEDSGAAKLLTHNMIDTSNALESAQWSFLAPVFRRCTDHVEYPEEIVLPFDSISTTNRPTHFGSLRKATICPSHQEFYGSDGVSISKKWKQPWLTGTRKRMSSSR